ncbi:MAG: hypothetical protein LBJ83_03225 [Oscillospiraceae bacterium]|jgi:hypothetical protein|nr:hypothetical protein [Oscillospiraceae bacterium]
MFKKVIVGILMLFVLSSFTGTSVSEIVLTSEEAQNFTHCISWVGAKKGQKTNKPVIRDGRRFLSELFFRVAAAARCRAPNLSDEETTVLAKTESGSHIMDIEIKCGHDRWKIRFDSQDRSLVML